MRLLFHSLTLLFTSAFFLHLFEFLVSIKPRPKKNPNERMTTTTASTATAKAKHIFVVFVWCTLYHIKYVNQFSFMFVWLHEFDLIWISGGYPFHLSRKRSLSLMRMCKKKNNPNTWPKSWIIPKQRKIETILGFHIFFIYILIAAKINKQNCWQKSYMVRVCGATIFDFICQFWINELLNVMTMT